MFRSPLARWNQQFNSRLQQSQIVQRTHLVPLVLSWWPSRWKGLQRGSVSGAHLIFYVVYSILCYVSLLYHDMQLQYFFGFFFLDWANIYCPLNWLSELTVNCLWLCEMTVYWFTAFIKCPWASERHYINILLLLLLLLLFCFIYYFYITYCFKKINYTLLAHDAD